MQSSLSLQQVKTRERFWHVEITLSVRVVPDWVQSPKPVRCPISEKVVDFVAQLQTPYWLKMIGKPFKGFEDLYARSHQKLKFLGDGDLFIFHAHETKIVSVFIQNT